LKKATQKLSSFLIDQNLFENKITQNSHGNHILGVRIIIFGG
jgi:hypothetical protein